MIEMRRLKNVVIFIQIIISIFWVHEIQMENLVLLCT